MLSSPSWRLVQSLAWVLQSAKLIPDRNKPTSASDPAAFLRGVLMACYNSCILQIVAFPRGREGSVVAMETGKKLTGLTHVYPL